MDIATGKADFGAANWTTINRFLEQNPGKVKILPVSIETTGGALLLPNDDPRMKIMVDKAIAYLLDSGFIQEIMTRYMGNDPRAWLPPAPNYESSANRKTPTASYGKP
jgi:ABC-type amino acid transport substrate-binding protein